MKWKETFLNKRELRESSTGRPTFKESPGTFLKQKSKRSTEHQKEKTVQRADGQENAAPPHGSNVG